MTAGEELNLPEHRWVAHVLVERAEHVLVLRRRHGRYLGDRWDIPGGTVEEGESARAAACREAFEEVSLLVRTGEMLGHYTNADTNGRPICFHTVTFAGKEDDDAREVLLCPEEHGDHAWLPVDEALKFDLVWHVHRTLTAHASSRLGMRQSGW